MGNIKTNTNSRSFLMVVLMFVCMVMFTVTSFADTLKTEKVVIPASDYTILNASESYTAYKANGEKLQADKGKTGDDTLLIGLEKNTIIFNSEAFANATNKSRKKAVDSFVKMLADSNVSSQTQQNIFETMSSYDRDLQAIMIPLIFDSTSADLYTALKWVTPLLSILRVILGLGSIILVVLIIGSTVMDCVYIGIPMARGGKDGSNGSNDKPFGVSYDAISVVKEVESSLDGNSKYKNGYLLYLRRRAITYFALGLCLLYLIVGELGGLMAWLMSLGSGVVS